MEFRKTLADELKGRLQDDTLKVLKVEYFQKQQKLRIYCTGKDLLSWQDEEVILDTTEEILKGRIDVDITVIPLGKSEPQGDEAHKDFILHLFQKDPIAKNFFRDALMESLEDELIFRHGNAIIVNHLNRKNTGDMIETFFWEVFQKSVKIRLIHDGEVLVPQPLVREEAPVVIKAQLPEKPLPKPEPKAEPMTLKMDKGDDAVLYGKRIKDSPTPILDLSEGMRSATIGGVIFKREDRELRNGKTLVSLYVSDNTGSLLCKIFAKDAEEVKDIKEGLTAKFKGKPGVDLYTKELSLMVNHVERTQVVPRRDQAEEKRVELHAHTTMSTMDGVVSAKALIKQAIAWGHEAIAITDHGVVQAYPEAMDAAGDKIKVLYGLEAYLVDDITGIASGEEAYSFQDEFVVFDIETTGFSHLNDAIIEIGAVKIKQGRVEGRFSSFVNPDRPIPGKITELTGIGDAMVKDAPKIEAVLPEFLAFCGDAMMVAHNANFDMGFIRTNAGRLNLPFSNEQWDTVPMARFLFPALKRHRLDSIAKHLNIFMGSHHRAVDDAQTTVEILNRSMDLMKERGIEDSAAMNAAYRQEMDLTKPMPDHAILLAKNQAGLKRLYELVSDSHLKWFNRNPRLPKSLVAQSRQDLFIGSACTNSQLFSAILDGRRQADIETIAGFYDYLEIQPAENHRHLLEENRCSLRDIKDINRRIVDLGKQLDIPVAATGDVHMLQPGDEAFRKIITYCQGFGGRENDSPQYFRTTGEMLAAFDELSPAEAYSAVIEVPNRIARAIEPCLPIPKETYPPKMEGAEAEIRKMTWDKAKSIYGDPLPEVVKARVDRELDSIIGNGYAVLYLVAHKLVKKSINDGYLVGSRGSVGSSLVATFTDITEVNGLPPHYVCPKCQQSEFFQDGSVASGVDLPEKNCPACGTTYHRDGHDIPFETFLGFSGDKEPDIDLNFSGDNQPAIHKYCEVLFGEGFVFRAGTITTVAEKTAMGYVRKYHEEKELTVSRAEMERLALGCTGIKRSTGQHPGGIMVVPSDNDIHNFCPVQRPADDVKSETITTHFDYHSISGRLLKLDILGHDDPTMLRYLKDVTGIDPTHLPLNDEKVLSLFQSPQALGITAEDLGSPVGTAGIPEFGTGFVRQMLVDTKPKTFSDLVRISGLSHGTDVWLNNAQYYIKNGMTDLAGCISLRDNIMLYLIQCGLPSKDAFFITEHVRKGKGLKPEEEAQMREFQVPDWYIESCKKIKYMFPKGHAVAYVTMAMRIAWYKVYHPLAYYAAYFSIRAKDFDAELCLAGPDAVKQQMAKIHEMGNEASAKDLNLLGTLELVHEMFCRGLEFSDIDIYKSRGTLFEVQEGKLRPPFASINGVGDNAGLAIEEEAKKGEFFSKEDFKKRTKATRTVMETLERVGCFKDLGDTDQISFF